MRLSPISRRSAPVTPVPAAQGFRRASGPAPERANAPIAAQFLRRAASVGDRLNTAALSSAGPLSPASHGATPASVGSPASQPGGRDRSLVAARAVVRDLCICEQTAEDLAYWTEEDEQLGDHEP